MDLALLPPGTCPGPSWGDTGWLLFSSVGPGPIAVRAEQVLVLEQGHSCHCGVRGSPRELAELFLLHLMGSWELCHCSR